MKPLRINGIKIEENEQSSENIPSVNACKLCAPLGATLVFRGIEGGIALLHGSQGCATYIRRFLISHFREPIDIASSNFSESSAIFGGMSNLREALRHVEQQYQPAVIGVATTCLAETIGDDVPGLLRIRNEEESNAVPTVFVSTPSYSGTHAEGYQAAMRAVVNHLARIESPNKDINIFPGMVSPEDLRQIKKIVAAFELGLNLLPDYSDTLDGGAWSDYHALPPGGTTLAQIGKMGGSQYSLQLGATLNAMPTTMPTAAEKLHEKFQVPYQVIPFPVGVRATDQFVQQLSQISGKSIPAHLSEQRARLLDAYADGHKIVYGVRVAVYGEEDMVCAMANWLVEIGCQPVLIASGGYSGRLRTALQNQIDNFQSLKCSVLSEANFDQVGRKAQEAGAQLLVGSSKGYPLSREMNIPLLRVGFPVHDRFGGGRILHFGYDGGLRLFDQLVNLLLEQKQSNSPIGYGYF